MLYYISGLLESESLRLNDVCSVNIYMRDMEEYAALNEVYVQTFNFPNPPTRVCVQCPLPADVGLIFDAVSETQPYLIHVVVFIAYPEICRVENICERLEKNR